MTTTERPASVPANAIWVGGVDGGVYVLISKQTITEKQIYQGQIYFENGEISYNGKMRLQPAQAVFNDINNKDSYSGWDGEILYLTNNRSLKAVDKID